MAIPEQQAQSDALKWFDVTGCDSGKRHRIRYGSAANVHEIDDAGHTCLAGKLTEVVSVFL
jgi:hypothetical protein